MGNTKIDVKTDIIGNKYGRLIVISYSHEEIKYNKNNKKVKIHYYNCKCDCGTENYITNRNSLIQFTTRSCGCLQKEFRHGDSKTRLYGIWCNMKARCYNKNQTEYDIYGGRGISICDEWIYDYLNFKEWSLSNRYTDELTIDRINYDGNYEPNNCRWATYKIQANNTSRNREITYNGETKTMAEWSDKLNISYTTLRKRLYDGWNIERALTEDINKAEENRYHESIIINNNMIYLDSSYGLISANKMGKLCGLNPTTIGKYLSSLHTADEVVEHYSKSKRVSIEAIVENCLITD